MTATQTIWTIIFVIALLLFLVVEIVVVIGGARDVIHLMKVLLNNATKR